MRVAVLYTLLGIPIGLALSSLGFSLSGVAAWLPDVATLVYGLVAVAVVACLPVIFLMVRGRSRGGIPSRMKAVMLLQHLSNITADPTEMAPDFEVREVNTPVPRNGEVLIRVEVSPVNPSDQSYLKGTYNSAQRDPLPCTIGFEGSGTVVQSGGGIVSGLRVGQRVACISKKSGCMWAQYAVIPAMQTIPLPDDVSFIEGSSMFVNPFTAVAFLEIAQAGRHRSIIMTAAASALGRMVLRLARSHGIRVITIVRSSKDQQLLEQLGSALVVVTSEEGWEQRLREKATELNCRLAFDAVAGDLPGVVLAQMPPQSSIYVYGGLSNQPCGRVRPTELLFKKSKFKGFWLTAYLQRKSIFGVFQMKNKVVAAIKDELRCEFGSVYPLADTVQAVASSNPDHGKSLIAPWQ